MEMFHHKIYKSLVLALLLFVLPATALHATKVTSEDEYKASQQEQLDEMFTLSVKEYKG